MNARHLVRALLPALVVPVAITALAGPSSATTTCSAPDGILHYVTSTSMTTSRVGTNQASDYLRGPGTITRTQSGTATASIALSASATGDVSLIVASASATAGVTLTGSYSWTGSWSYSKPVPSGTTARMRLFRESRAFTANKYNWVCSSAGGRYVLQYSTRVNAPRGAGAIAVWDLEYA